MGSFSSNVNADLKSGFKGAVEDIGENIPVNSEGTCSHPFLILNTNKTSCNLPPRIDIGRHFVMSGGPDGAREDIGNLISRVSSFGRYLVGDLA